jgi:hypothetical protein
MEATMIFPLVMLSTVALLFLGLFVYQRVSMEQLAQNVAERAAYVWDNSYKDARTGNFNPVQHDGLYWRITQDSISDLFGFLVSNSETVVELPRASSGSMNLSERKLINAAMLLLPGLTGRLTYTNHGFDRKVTATLQQLFHRPEFISKWLSGNKVQAHAVNRVVEPVELIRITDMTRTYIGLIKDRISPKAAREALIEPNGNNAAEAVTIRSEAQAAAYLRTLVNGVSKVVTTTSGKSRTIDAMDSNGIAHIAFYTFTDSQLRAEQMPKDAELLQAGDKVKGVVWHFFKKGAVPSIKLRKELESKGIVIVIHE